MEGWGVRGLVSDCGKAGNERESLRHLPLSEHSVSKMKQARGAWWRRVYSQDSGDEGLRIAVSSRPTWTVQKNPVPKIPNKIR